mmetsp:Transcript_18230/g.31032  ORF Transcript_18230/g.31032 Transcript_18230/m.31032 type:complete len:358 (-) Transcript_18230:980-2053(-)
MHASLSRALYRPDAQAPSPRTRRAERARRREARLSRVSVCAASAAAGTLPVRERGAARAARSVRRPRLAVLAGSVLDGKPHLLPRLPLREEVRRVLLVLDVAHVDVALADPVLHDGVAAQHVLAPACGAFVVADEGIREVVGADERRAVRRVAVRREDRLRVLDDVRDLLRAVALVFHRRVVRDADALGVDVDRRAVVRQDGSVHVAPLLRRGSFGRRVGERPRGVRRGLEIARGAVAELEVGADAAREPRHGRQALAPVRQARVEVLRDAGEDAVDHDVRLLDGRVRHDAREAMERQRVLRHHLRRDPLQRAHDLLHALLLRRELALGRLELHRVGGALEVLVRRAGDGALRRALG